LKAGSVAAPADECLVLNSTLNTQHSALAVGVFGGTFDPIHYGHLRPAAEARAALALDRLLVMPAARSPFREAPIACDAHRWRMTELGCAEFPGLIPDDRELRRGGLSYAIETLESLRAEYPAAALVLIVGTDAAAGLERWHRWPHHLELAHIVQLSRPGCEAPVPGWARERVCADAAGLRAERAGRFLPFTVSPQRISSTDIRARLAKKESITGLVPEAVRVYIETNHLYGA
jgi:nicotinate-nucleotide adenylyltransferase